MGVNLGGWLVVEKWITPSLFEGIKATNHYQLETNKTGRIRLKKHFESFITETDIQWLHEVGVELLRVPFGHWLFGGEPYQASIKQLDWLVEITKKYDMQVLLDMHAAVGAQNNRAHSGSGNRANDNLWLNTLDWQDKTIDVLVQIAKRYNDQSHIWGIELLNEPRIDATGLKLIDFYRRAYKEITKVARPGTRIVFSDAFTPLLTVNAFGWLAKRDYPVVIDTHIYYCFGKKNKQRAIDEQTSRARWSRWYIQLLSVFQPVLVGEWSGMLPYRTTEAKTSSFLRAQQESYRHAAAWCYWTYKTEDTGRWNFRDMVERNKLRLLQ